MVPFGRPITTVGTTKVISAQLKDAEGLCNLMLRRTPTGNHTIHKGICD